MKTVKTNRKAQQGTEVFIYIIGIVIVAMILYFGYGAVKGFGEKGEQISLINLKTEMENSIRSSMDFGKITFVNPSLPGNLKELCFVGDDVIDNADAGGLIDSTYPGKTYHLIKDSVKSQVQKNMFLVGTGGEITSFYVGKIQIEAGFICFQRTGSKLTVRLEGFGDKTKVSQD